jgi:Pvc16 N-terminal domain
VPGAAVTTDHGPVISAIDASLRALVEREVLSGSDAEVVFDAPTREWGARRTTPTVDVYLYDVREDLDWREYGFVDVCQDGLVTGRARPPRRFKFSYLVTAWTQRPEDEHHLLSGLLDCFVLHDHIPEDVLAPPLDELPEPVSLTIALPPPKDRALSDVWSALGGELKPSLDIVVIAPWRTAVSVVTAPPVREEPKFSFLRPDGTGERPVMRRHTRAQEPTRSRFAPEETIHSGTDEHPGRTVRIGDVGDR